MPAHSTTLGNATSTTSQMNGSSTTQSSHVLLLGTHRFSDGPVGELLQVAEMSEVVDVAEELVLQLRILDHRHGTVLVGRGMGRGRGHIEKQAEECVCECK